MLSMFRTNLERMSGVVETVNESLVAVPLRQDNMFYWGCKAFDSNVKGA